MVEQELRLLNGDCKELFGKVEDNSIDLIITDPPYGVDYSKGFDDSIEYVSQNVRFWLEEMYRVLKPSSHCYIFIPTKEAGLWISLIQEIFNFNNIIATRTITNPLGQRSNFLFNCQLVVYCSKGKPKNFNNYDFFYTSEDWLKDKENKNPHPFSYSYPAFISQVPANSLVTKQNRDNRHPCEKNMDLLKLFVGISSSEGEKVMDCFMGSGNTGLAAYEMGRSFVGFEMNEDYYNTLYEKFANAAIWRGTKIEVA